MKYNSTTPAGETVKGDVVLLVDEKEATEFDIPANGIKLSCYALTKPGQILAARSSLSLGPEIEEFVDLVIDGVLRATSIVKKGAEKGKKGTLHKASFEKALFYRVEGGKKKGLKLGQMEVKAREGVSELSDNLPSTVGTIELQHWRKYPEDAGAADASDEEAIKRAPSFEEHTQWSDLNEHASASDFEVGFTNGNGSWKVHKDRFAEERKDFEFFASFTFRLTSSESLRKMDLSVPPTPDLSPVQEKKDAGLLQVPEKSLDADDSITVQIPAENKKDGESTSTDVPAVAPIAKVPAKKSTNTKAADPENPSTTKTKKTKPKPKPIDAISGAEDPLQLDVQGKKVDAQFDSAFNQILKINPFFADDTPSKKKPGAPNKKSTSLQGMPGGPASKESREKAATEEPRGKTPSEREASVALTEPSKGPNNEFTSEKYDDIFKFQSLQDGKPANPIVKAIPADGKPKSKSKLKSSVQNQGPLTPPPSTRKPQQQVRLGSVPAGTVKSTAEVEITVEATDTESTQEGMKPAEALQSQQSVTETETQQAGQGAILKALGKSIQECSFASNASTEIPETQEIAPTADQEAPRTPTRFGLVTEEQEEPHTPDTQRMASPVLGDSPASKHQRRVSFPESPSDRVRRMWQTKSDSKDLSKMFEEHDSTRSQSVFDDNSLGIQFQSQSQSQIMRDDPVLGQVIATQILSKPISFKRKLVDMSGGFDNTQQRKRSVTPAVKLTDEIQRRTMGAQARIAAAKEEKRKLDEEVREAEVLGAEREKVIQLEEQAQKLERENAEAMARIAAIYGN